MVWPQNINWNFFLHADVLPGILRQDPSNILNVHDSHSKTDLLFRQSQLWNHLPEEHPYFLLIKIFHDFLLYDFRSAKFYFSVLYYSSYYILSSCFNYSFTHQIHEAVLLFFVKFTKYLCDTIYRYLWQNNTAVSSDFGDYVPWLNVLH